MSIGLHDEARQRETGGPHGVVAGHGRGALEPAERPGIGSTDLLLVSMALIWSINFSVIKYGFRFVPPLAYNAARIVLGAGAALIVLAWWRRRNNPVTPHRLRLFLLGMLGNGLYQFF